MSLRNKYQACEDSPDILFNENPSVQDTPVGTSSVFNNSAAKRPASSNTERASFIDGVESSQKPA